MKILEQLRKGDFSQLPAWLDSYGSTKEINTTIEVNGKQWSILHFLAEAAAKGSPVIDTKRLVLKALELGANIHMGDIDGVKGDTPFNILAPSTLPSGLEAGSILTDHWFDQATRKYGSKSVSDTSGSHNSTLTQYIGKWSKGKKVEEQLRKIQDMGVDIARLNASGWNGLHAAVAMGNVDAVAALSKLYTREQLKLKTAEDYTAPYGVTFPAGADAIETAQARIDQKEKDRDTSVTLISNIRRCISIVGARLDGASTSLFAEKAKLVEGWAQNVRLEIGSNGTIIGVERDAKYAPTDGEKIPVIIPAMPGPHSHLHQYATVVGYAEKVDPAQPDNTFWEWRDQMYGGLKDITPDQFGVIARKVYSEYLKAGYSGVAEFHYLLNQPEDKDYMPYPMPNTMAEIAIEAAKEVGLQITMLPVLYRHGNFGGQPFTRGEQRRFFSETRAYLENVKSLIDRYRGDSTVHIGIALHSLRAVSEEDMKGVFGTDWVARGTFPIHIHIAEQTKEVEDCVSYSRKTPIDFLYDFLDANFPQFDKSRLVLIHATHMTQEETRRVAKSGATICFCPTTEANLGDGILAHTPEYIKSGGKIAIAPDQNGVINPFQELFLLDAENRYFHRKRIATGLDGDGLWERAAEGGGAAMGVNTGVISIGNRADIIALSPAAITNASSLPMDRLMDAAVFNPGMEYPVENVMVGGRWVVWKKRLQSPSASIKSIDKSYDAAVATIHREKSPVQGGPKKIKGLKA